MVHAPATVGNLLGTVNSAGGCRSTPAGDPGTLLTVLRRIIGSGRALPPFMKIKSAVFTVSAPGLASCPPAFRPEFAFIGRSNVGKSSLINALAGQKDLALVSNTPGKTKLINFFLMNGAWSLVDLPGYGHAQGGKAVHAGFERLIVDYLTGRPTLARVFVLIDSRLPPQAIDLEFIEWLGAQALPFALVFTKSDKQSAGATSGSVARFIQQLPRAGVAEPRHFITSSKTQQGRGELLQFIEQLLADAKPGTRLQASLRP
jgi:GTP-binding protein